MSICYTVKEHLSVRDARESADCDLLFLASHQIALLASRMLEDEGEIFSLQLVADGEEYAFSGREITPQLHAVLRALCTAKTVDLCIDYSFVWRAEIDELDVGPFVLCGAVEELLAEDERQYENVFYSMYHQADSSFGDGVLVAHGQKNGRRFCGMVDFLPSELPETGCWENADTLLVLEAPPFSGVDAAFLGRVAQDFSELGAEVVCQEAAQELCFYVNRLVLRSKEGFLRLIELYRRLQAAVGDEPLFLGGLVDLSGRDAAILELAVQKDSYSVQIARV